MKNVFKITNKYIVLLTPLLLYSLFSSIYLAVSAMGGNVYMLFFALVLFFFMTAAFSSGWFYMIKLATIDNIKEPNSLIKEFTSGVGEYILPSLGLLINILIISILMLVISCKLGLLLIGDVGISIETFAKAFENTATLKAFIAGLSQEDLIRISNWNLLILGTISLTYFILMLYLPALFFESKNPFKALIISLKRLFSKKFLNAIVIYVLIFITNFILSLLATIFANNTIIHFLITLANFYFITLVSVGIFYYYYKTFIINKLGQNIDIKA